MAYVKNNWVDREGTTRYFETVDDDGALILTPDYTQVTEMGTPVNADNMNHIEEGIAAGSFTKYDSMATYAKNDLVTTIVDNELKVYKSLQDNNTNALDDSSFWEEVEFSGGGGGHDLFDTKLSDHILTYEETKGWALQGTYVYKEALAGSRYGYPDFYSKCLEEYNEATSTETINGIEVKVHSNGHKFYDIANKAAIDDFFNSIGSAWFYGVDTENERIFLPRNNWFEQATGDASDVGQSVEAGLPNITGSFVLGDGINAGAIITSPTGAFGNEYMSWGYSGRAGNANNTFKGNFDASRSNAIYGKSNTVQPNSVKKLLYICVGNTTNYVGMTEVVNQGMEILEQVNQGIESRIKLDGSNAEFPVVVESYQNGNSGYILYSLDQNGRTRCIQWGFKEAVGSYGQTTINLLKPIQVPYVVQANIDWADSLVWYTSTEAVQARAMTDITAVPSDKTSNSFKLQSYSNHSWRIDGYLI